MSTPQGEGPIYLDHNATTPVDPRVAQACWPYLTEHFGNPSSDHQHGRAARSAVDGARAELARLLEVAPEEIVLTGSGSEANTLAIRGAALARRERGDHIITQDTEHPSVLAACDAFARLHGFRVTRLPVGAEGLVDPADLDAALTGDTVLVSIMHANNETGTVQPIADLASRAHRRGALLHTDASQSAGKIAVSARDLEADLVTVTGHKMYAPKGVGALRVRPGVELVPVICGGGQERGLRAGTENVALIAALGRAAQIAREEREAEAARLERLRDALHDQLDQRLPGRVQLNGHSALRLPNTLNVSIDGTRGDQILAAATGMAASTGSACHEGEARPSTVLTAMGLSSDRARAALRLTLGRWTTAEHVDRAAALLAEAAGR